MSDPRRGALYHVRDGEIQHFLTLVPLIPQGWGILIDGRPGYGGRRMHFHNAIAIINRIKTNMLIRALNDKTANIFVKELKATILPFPGGVFNGSTESTREDDTTVMGFGHIPVHNSADDEIKAEEKELKIESAAPAQEEQHEQQG